MALHFALPNAAGVRVESIERGTAAAQAALEPGDVIVTLNGRSVNGIDDLHRALTAELIGVPVEISVLRRAQLLKLQVVPSESI
jgi:S1-C subfamily serine protease